MASVPTLVLLICADRESAGRLAAAIQPRGHRVVAMPYGPTALAKAAGAQLIVVDRIEGPTDVVEVVRQIKGQAELAATPLLAIAQGDTVEDRVRLLEAGADDVVSRPVDPMELQLRIDALLVQPPEVAVADLTTAAAPPRSETGRPRVFAFLSPKGGAGTTTAAVNVAVALARDGRSVALIDLDLSFGAVAMHLDIRPRYSVVQAVRDDLALEDPEALRTYATVKDGLAVFSSPLTPDQAEMVGPEDVRRLLSVAAAAYDVTVVDAGSAFDERTLTVMEIADRVAILATPEIAALRSVRALVDALAEYQNGTRRPLFVLNHLFPTDMLTREDVHKALGDVELMEMPYEQNAYLRAVNTGVPVVTGAPKSAAAQRLVRLGEVLMGEGDAEPVEGVRRLRLAGVLRRG